MAVYDEGFAPNARSMRITNLMNYAGAALSLALILGVGVWGYKLVVRDVSGIPVVRAMEGDMRVLPDNPGGAVSPHTGFAVNEVAASGEAGGPEDVLFLAPRDTGLAQEDLAVQLAPEAAEVLDTVAVITQDGVETPASAEETVTPASAEVDEIALLTEMLAANPATLPAETAIETIPASVPGVTSSLRPVTRPAGISTSGVTSASASASEVLVSTATFAAGTNLVHLGAYATPAEAAEAWERLNRRLGEYLTGYARVIQVSNQSGGTWYRLRASGLQDRAEARRLCAALQAEAVECIAVVTN